MIIKYISKLIYNIKYSKEGDYLTRYEENILTKSDGKECPHCRKNSIKHQLVEQQLPYSIYVCDICGFSTTLSDGIYNTYLINKGFNRRFIDTVSLRKHKIENIIRRNKQNKSIFKWFYSKK